MNGLEGVATRSLTLNGLPVTEPINIPHGYGIWDQTNETFLFEDGAPILGDSTSNIESQMLNKGLMIGHEAKIIDHSAHHRSIQSGTCAQQLI